MDDWRDDLPPIPSDRIRRAAIREGDRRREVRDRRLAAALYGGMGVGAVGLFIAFGAFVATRSGGDDDDAGSETTAGGAGTEAPTGTTGAPGTSAAPGGTEPSGTEPAAGTTTAGTGAPGTTGAPATTAGGGPGSLPEHTTIAGTIADLPPSDELSVFPIEIWEEPAGGGPDCGPTTYTVNFQPTERTPETPVVHWETAGARDDAEMVPDEFGAHATIGPFPADTLEEGATHQVLVYVTDAEAAGDEIFRGPTVILHDCSP
jgi:hypothetical protein